MSNRHVAARSSRPLAGQSCCAVVLHTPATNCGIDCVRGHRHAPDYNVGRFIKQLQAQFFDVHKSQYPMIMFHQDLEPTQKRIMRGKTLSAIMFYKINLNPMALPIHLRSIFASIVNATKDAHRNGDLFRPEKKDATFRGFQQRMLSRFYVGEMLLDHKALRGYKYILRFDATDVRIESAFSYDPFVRSQMLKSIYSYHSINMEYQVTVINPVLKGWMEEHTFSGHLLKPFITSENGAILHNGMAYSRSAELFKLQAFKTSVYKSMFESADKDGVFLLGESYDKSVTDGQFLGLSMPFVASIAPKAVTELTDLPIRCLVDMDESYL